MLERQSYVEIYILKLSILIMNRSHNTQSVYVGSETAWLRIVGWNEKQKLFRTKVINVLM